MNISRLLFFVTALAVLTSCGPTARFTFDQEDKQAPATVVFNNDSKKADQFEWNFGDGSTSTEENPKHNYYLSGKYQVELKVTKNNKSQNVTQEIFVKAPDVCLVLIETDFGNILIQLYDETPKHRDNFLKLAEEGFYDGLLFHRIIDGFMIQGGDPKSKNAKKGAPLGSGGPGYTIPAEMNTSLVHIKGALAAARQGDGVNPEKRSSGSQFYIVDGKRVPEGQLKNFGLSNGIKYTAEQKNTYMTQGGTPQLDMNYTVFGQVIEGIEVIDAIALVKKDGKNRPIDDVKMTVKVIK